MGESNYQKEYIVYKGDRENITPGKDNLVNVPNLSIGSSMYNKQFYIKSLQKNDNNLQYKKQT